IGQRDDADPVTFQLSPDDRTIAVSRTVNGNQDIWLLDAIRGVLRRFTTAGLNNTNPAWSRDGSQISYASRQQKGNLNIYGRSVNGTGADEALVESPGNKQPDDWSPDGRFMLYESDSPKTGQDLLVLAIADRKSSPVAETSADEDQGHFSPDGHWIVFQSNETGRFEIYIQPF